MQETRKQILHILRDRHSATIDDIVCDLTVIRGSITPVTVRHHLTKLQEDGLVNIPELRHHDGPGRPQYVYSLTDQGHSHFPNNYQNLAVSLLNQIESCLPPDQVEQILDRVSLDLANGAEDRQSDKKIDVEARLQRATDYLNEHGYDARWESTENGYYLYTHNCPYHQIASRQDAMCRLDRKLVTELLGMELETRKTIAEGAPICAYFIPSPTKTE